MPVTPDVHDFVAEADALTSLKEFFEAWDQLARPSEPATSLRVFLKKYAELQSSLPTPERAHVPQPLDPVRLGQFCKAFRPVFANLQREGEFVDVWSVARLKRDELRHASVLAWFLNPNASHGFEQEIFRTWMSRLSFPGEPRLRIRASGSFPTGWRRKSGPKPMATTGSTSKSAVKASTFASKSK